MSSIINSSNIGKCYTIHHEGIKRNDTLRDEITNWVRGLSKKGIRNHKATSKENFWALKDITFDIKPGERIGIIGRNGAGKSTLLKILSRITEPTVGEIRIKGRVASLLEVGTGFHPELSGRENVYLNGAILGMSRSEIKRKFDEIIDFAEIGKFLDTPVKRYSSGMYVRLAFAVAAHLEPEILIVDEVLAVGDAQFQKKCLGKMESVGKEGRTVIFVSHNMGAVKTLCSTGILISAGQLLLKDTVSNVVSKYISDIQSFEYSKTWDDGLEPANRYIKLKKISLIPEEEKSCESITTDDSFSVKVDYQCICDGALIGLTLVLYTESGDCVFSSINNQDNDFYGNEVPKGVYYSECQIPKQLLNQGVYTVDVIFFEKQFSQIKTIKNALNFEIHDGPSLRKDYFGEFGGFVRPKLTWQNIKIN